MKRHLLPLLITLFGLAACKKVETDPIPALSTSTFSFDENINIEMYETIEGTKRRLNLNCYTEKIYPTMSYEIRTVYTVDQNTIAIQFITIDTPGIAPQSPDPAYALIELDGLTNKSYKLELNFGNKIIRGELRVSPTSIDVSIPTQTKVQFVDPDLERIPNNTVFGYILSNSNTTEPLAQNFIDSLHYYGAKSNLYIPGYYWYFKIEENGQIEQGQNSVNYFKRNFIFDYTNNSMQLENLAKRFKEKYNSEFNINLYTVQD